MNTKIVTRLASTLLIASLAIKPAAIHAATVEASNYPYLDQWNAAEDDRNQLERYVLVSIVSGNRVDAGCGDKLIGYRQASSQVEQSLNFNNKGEANSYASSALMNLRMALFMCKIESDLICKGPTGGKLQAACTAR